MAVAPHFPHPDYTLMAPTWRKLRDVYAGREALLRGTTRYLPQPTNMDDERYQGYLTRPKWFGATRRTVQAFEGLAFRQPLSVAAPPKVEAQLETLTSTGVSLQSLARLIFRETLLMGRYGVLVDMDSVGQRPFWAGYPAEQITNWTVGIVDGRRQLIHVELVECDYVLGADGHTQEPLETIRTLQLIDGIYTQTVELVTSAGTRQQITQVVPQRQGGPLTFLPFVFFGVNDLESQVELSPINDLADTNLSYWRHSADYEWSLHLTASPTPWVTGHDPSLDLGPDGQPLAELVLGSDMAIFLKEADAKIGMLEFQGHGLEPLRQAMLDDKAEMASLGARLLEGQPETNETLGAFRMRQAGDTSVIAALAQALSAGLTRLLRMHAFWFGAAQTAEDTRVRCSLPTNFVTVKLEPQMLTALLAGVQSGHISQETFYYNLGQGEMTEPGITFEEEQSRIESQMPAMARLVTPNGSTNGATKSPSNGVVA